MPSRPSVGYLHRELLNRTEKGGRESRGWVQAADRKPLEMATKVPRGATGSLNSSLPSFWKSRLPYGLSESFGSAYGCLRKREVWALDTAFFFHTPTDSTSLGASKQVYPVAVFDRNQKFRLNGRKLVQADQASFSPKTLGISFRSTY